MRRREASELDESMHYKMLGYSTAGEFVFHLNAQQRYASLYVGDISTIDPVRVLLDGLDAGKRCIRFRKSTPVQSTRIDTFIARALELWKQGDFGGGAFG